MGKWVTCLGCLEPFDISDPNAFRDEEARREFSISGLCQMCQIDLNDYRREIKDDRRGN
jgi:hypothetical protein